jgi:hypothetical protein
MEISINAPVSSTGTVNDIKIYDDFLDTDTFISMYRYICDKNKWKYGHSSNPIGKTKESWYDAISGVCPSDITPLWSMDLTDDKYFSQFIFEQVKKVTEKDWDIEFVYANGSTYGQHGSLHQDHPEGYTMLIYSNIHWDMLWGGRTIFIDENSEIKYIDPIPNRAIFFPGTILHCSDHLSRDFRGLRITLAYKLFPKKES